MRQIKAVAGRVRHRSLPGIKPKAPGERLPVPAGWRFGCRIAQRV